MSTSITDTTTKPDANVRQVGGDHYGRHGGIQHWDLMGQYGIDYFRSAATKYVQRWRDKNGVQDLEKAEHYLQKYCELLEDSSRKVTLSAYGFMVPSLEFLDWARQVGMHAAELSICYLLLCAGEVGRAREQLQELIRAERTAPVYMPGTPEDGGHHARQAEEGEEIQNWNRTDYDAHRLPHSLSEHEFRHRMAFEYQNLYVFDVSAARWVIRTEHARRAMNGRQD